MRADQEASSATFEADLADALHGHVAGWTGVARRKMFGRPCWTAHGIMFAGVDGGSVILTRLHADDRAALEARFGAGPFEAHGKAMATWSRIEIEPEEVSLLGPWIQRSYLAATSHG